MLPKVASHIFHQTSRVAATAQNYALRNVLGIQPPATSGTVSAWNSAGSSSWGAYGAGPGGAKYSTGSRFYQGYTVRNSLYFTISSKSRFLPSICFHSLFSCSAFGWCMDAMLCMLFHCLSHPSIMFCST